MRREASPGKVVAVCRGEDHQSQRAGAAKHPSPLGRGDHFFDTEGSPHLGWCGGLIIRLRGRITPDGFDSPAFRLSLKTPGLVVQLRGNHFPGGFAQNVTSQHHSSEFRRKSKGIRYDLPPLPTHRQEASRP